MSEIYKILFVARPDIDSKPGGDTVQVYETKIRLEKMGYEIKCINPSDAHSGKNLSAYHLVHFFNLSLIYQYYRVLRRVNHIDIPIVLSPIFWDMRNYEKQSNSVSLLKTLFLRSTEFIPKKIARMYLSSRIKSMAFNKYYIGQMREGVKLANLILPNAQIENVCLQTTLQLECTSRVIPNAARWNDGGEPHSFRIPDKFILSVGRIEMRKNQINLIKAIHGLSLSLVLIGDINQSEKNYWKKCKEVIRKLNVHVIHIPHQRFEIVSSLYKQALLHVQPSWFETPGLSSLEASAAGCPIVCTNVGSAQEYFCTHAEYCTPSDATSIREAIIRCMNKANDRTLLRDIVRRTYNWDIAAQKTHEAYQTILQ